MNTRPKQHVFSEEKNALKLIFLLLWSLSIMLSGVATAADPAVKQAQQHLQTLGYHPGPADGLIGRKTIAAIQHFQSDRQLPVTGELDPATRQELGIAISASNQEVYPELISWVNDYTNTLTSQETQTLDAMLEAFEQATSNQVFIAVMQHIPGDFSLEEYVNELFERWQPGQKDLDNGVLLAVFLGDRKMRIEVGYGLEALLTDAACKLIITNQIAPNFQQQQYFQGLHAGITSILGTLEGTYTPRQTNRTLTTKLIVQWLIGVFFGSLSGILMIARLLSDLLRPFMAKSNTIAHIIAFLETSILPRNPIVKFLAGVVVIFTSTGMLAIFLPEQHTFWALIFLVASPFLWSIYSRSPLKFLLIAPFIFVLVFSPFYFFTNQFRYAGILLFGIVLIILGIYNNIKAGRPWYGSRSSDHTNRNSWSNETQMSNSSSSRTLRKQQNSHRKFHGGGGGRSGGGGASGDW